MTEETRKRLRDNLDNKARPVAAKWHGSDAGRAWHAKHYAEMHDKMHRREWMLCEYCGRGFNGVANGTARFCSNACKSAWRRKAGLDDIIKQCEWCGREFKSNKYADVHTCSRSCANRARWLRSRAAHSENGC